MLVWQEVKNYQKVKLQILHEAKKFCEEQIKKNKD